MPLVIVYSCCCTLVFEHASSVAALVKHGMNSAVETFTLSPLCLIVGISQCYVMADIRTKFMCLFFAVPHQKGGVDLEVYSYF